MQKGMKKNDRNPAKGEIRITPLSLMGKGLGSESVDSRIFLTI